MKNLTVDEFMNAPHIVQYVCMSGITGNPIGANTLNEAIENHPEYFPDEIEHRRKWNAIPQEVHDAYLKDRVLLDVEISNNIPPSRGICGWIDDPEGYEEWTLALCKATATYSPKRKEIHDKHYAKYGIEYSGW
jgi:hypothetical protein